MKRKPPTMTGRRLKAIMDKAAAMLTAEDLAKMAPDESARAKGLGPDEDADEEAFCQQLVEEALANPSPGRPMELNAWLRRKGIKLKRNSPPG